MRSARLIARLLPKVLGILLLLLGAQLAHSQAPATDSGSNPPEPATQSSNPFPNNADTNVVSAIDKRVQAAKNQSPPGEDIVKQLRGEWDGTVVYISKNTKGLMLLGNEQKVSKLHVDIHDVTINNFVSTEFEARETFHETITKIIYFQKELEGDTCPKK